MLQGPDQEGAPPWAVEQEEEQPSAASALSHRKSSIRASSEHAEPPSRSVSIRARDLHRVPGGAVDTRSAVPDEIVGRKPEEALQLLRTSLAGRGVHGALEFAQQLRLSSILTPSGHMIGFTDIARVVARFCILADAYIHAIFRALDKDCHGCVSVAEIVDSVFVRLSIKQMNQVKIVFAVRSLQACLLS